MDWPPLSERSGARRSRARKVERIRTRSTRQFEKYTADFKKLEPHLAASAGRGPFSREPGGGGSAGGRRNRPGTIRCRAVDRSPRRPQLQLPTLPVEDGNYAEWAVVEDVIARVNDQIITRSEYERAEQQMVAGSRSSRTCTCGGVANERLRRHVLRDMIDQQLLLSQAARSWVLRGMRKLFGGWTRFVKQNHLESMEALEKAAAQQGVSYRRFKQGFGTTSSRQQVGCQADEVWQAPRQLTRS